jgi:imidazolonepropionase-like amidohydrolase
MRILTAAALTAILLTQQAANPRDVVLVGGTVYTDPESPPVPEAVVVLHDGRIQSVELRRGFQLPAGAEIFDCTNAVITAGFWNTHVHILPPALLHAAGAPDDQLQPTLDLMLNRWGFTSVFDLGSVLDNTLALRRRMADGDLRGPRLLTVGEPLWTEVPVYVRDFLLTNRIDMPTVNAPADASARVRGLIARHVDGIKLFTGSLQRGAVANMPLATARAAVDEAHHAGLPVFAHPQNLAGFDVALTSGVDVLAHTVPDSPEWTRPFVSRLTARHMMLIPTLTLFDFEARKGGESDADREQWLNKMVAEVRAFSASGGAVLFGTDVGYTDHYETGLELELMGRAGLDVRAILASLTTTPAARFASGRRTGQVRAGFEADVVVLDADPARDIRNFARVRYTIVGGRFTYGR